MKHKALLLSMLLGSGWACAQPAYTPRSGDTSRLVKATDPAFADLRQRYPELDGAYLVSTSRGVIRRAAFRRADGDQLRRLAEILLVEALVVPGSTWAEDPVHGRLLAMPTSDEVTVLQHRVDGIDVEGSFVVVRRQHDGGGEVSSSLIPVAPPAKVLLAPRRALGKAVGATSPVESMSARVWPETHYIRSPEGVARLVYRADTGDAKGNRWLLYVDAETGHLLKRVSQLAHFDSAPDDSNWTMPPWIWVGELQNGTSWLCQAPTSDKTETGYYPKGNELPGIKVQANITGPAERMRNPALGLTSIQWAGKTLQELESVWSSWTWTDLASQIFQSAGYPDCPGTYKTPYGYSGPVPYQAAEVEQYLHLQVAMQDIEERFGWQGLNNQHNPMLLVQNVDNQLSCFTHLPTPNAHFGIISCGLDKKAVANGMPQRIPPIEIFAHEFGHTIIDDLGFTWLQDFDQRALVEGLADIFAVSVKSNHGGDPWLLADRAAWMERNKESLCEAAPGGPYCSLPPMLANRDLAHPKTMNPVDPGAEFYAGDNWLKPYSISGKWNAHGSSQVVSHMLYRIAEGAPPGDRDGKPANGSYDEFAGIGLQAMLDIFAASLPSLQQVNFALSPLEDYAAQFRMAAIQQCGQWSEAELVSGKSAWVANLDLIDVDLKGAGYTHPAWDDQDVVPLTEFLFQGEALEEYQFQVATDADFMEIVYEDIVKSGASAQGRFLLKLSPHTDYWWRVRLASAPMISSKWVVQDEACWRPAAPFRTGGPAQVTNPTPAGATAATGDDVEAWNAVFGWTGHSRFDGYEFEVDDEEPEGGKYAKVWAHKVFEKGVTEWPLDMENPGSDTEPNFKVPPIPLPGTTLPGHAARHLCWTITPFARDDKGNRADGDVLEQCFRARKPETQITHPAPPAADGTLSHAPAQPLAINYDPADGAESHEFSLRLLALAGINAPLAEGQWAYEDNITTDAANHVEETTNPPDWTTRTRLRMLPVQLDASPYINYALNKVRLTIKSRSPEISSKANGGTYPPRRESAEPAIRDFHPSDPANFIAFHPYVFAPPSAGTCTSSSDPDVAVEFEHGSAATADVIEAYRVSLYPERCSSNSLGCRVIADPAKEDFVDSLAFADNVKHNGKATQRITFDRQILFPDEASEMNDVTGFLAHLYGVSGPEPGPANLNITGTTLVHLPVVPAKLVANVSFVDGGEANPEASKFVFFAQSAKGPDGFPRAGQYAPPEHDIDLHVYRGAGCHENQLVSIAPNHVDFDFDDLGLADDPNPVVSARAVLEYPLDMLCPTTTSACVSLTGTNRRSKPQAVTGLTPREVGGQLGASWNVPADANPESLEYYVGVVAQGNDSANMLVNHPATVILTNAELQSIENQVGLHGLAVLDPSDIDKSVILRVTVCRAGTNKCSDETTALYTIGASIAGGPLPTSPFGLALHFQEPGGILLPGQSEPIFQNGWITASWNPPSGATLPSYYLVAFSSTAAVPGVLPNWLNTLGLSGVNFAADASQYTAVIRALPEGLALSNTNWGDFVWLLAETHQSPPPASGTWVTAKVWACAGAAPLPTLRNHDWILGANLDTCGAPAEVSAQYP